MSPDPLGTEPFAVVVAGLVGLALGSFLNVCILRWGAEPKQSVVRPRSRCPRCGRGLAWYENIPVVSWLALRGRCGGCGLPISPQYPLVEAATAMLWAYLVWRYGPTLAALEAAVFVTILLGIAMADARAFIIPHEFTFGGLGFGLLFSLAQGPAGFIGALHGSVVGAGLLYLVGFIGSELAGREAMGGGDTAMMAMIGAFLGWQGVLATVFLGSVVGIVLHLLTLVLRRVRATAAAPLNRPASAPVVVPLQAEMGPPNGAKAGALAEAPTADREPTPEELRAAGYLPFGVSLAIAATWILFWAGPDRLDRWFADYARFLGV